MDTVASRTPTPLAADAAAPLSRAQAARWLAMAGFGGNAADVAALQSLGLNGWLAQQTALPRSQGHVDWMRANGYEVAAPNTGNIDRQGVERSVWRKLFSSPDVLRQRVTLALSELIVISLASVVLPWRGFASAAFMDVLEANAFGNWRELLLQVSHTPAMAAYLSFLNGKKGDPKLGSMPDENYAREVMQLFSIGLLQLNPDGTPRLVNGQPQPTYTQQDVTQLARVFTGWRLNTANRVLPADAVVRPLVQRASDHETGETTFLGRSIPAGTDGETALWMAVDVLMQQPSMGPFIARQLIQRLVTSNPSPAYVQRVAHVFDGNGHPRAKGDLKATVLAILTDAEALAETATAGPERGRLREPLLRFVQWGRTFGLSSPDGQWAIGNLSDTVRGLAQSPLRAPSVFNFFRPGYVPPATTLGERGITAPEFQITNETTVAAYLNFMQRVVANGIAGLKPDYGALAPLVDQPAALLAELNVLLAGGQLSAPTLAGLATALASINININAGNGRANRLHAAVLLVMAAPEYLVQK